MDRYENIDETREEEEEERERVGYQATTSAIINP